MEEIIHLVDPKSGTWYHMDTKFRLWSCDCKQDKLFKVSLCLTIDNVLDKEGILRDLNREINDKRKELGFLISETLEDGYKRLLNNK